MTESQYQQQLEQYDALGEQMRRETLEWLESEGHVEPGTTWSDEIEEMLVALMDA